LRVLLLQYLLTPMMFFSTKLSQILGTHSILTFLTKTRDRQLKDRSHKFSWHDFGHKISTAFRTGFYKK